MITTTMVNILTSIFEAIVIQMFINTFVDKKDVDRPAYTYFIAVITLAAMINISNKLAGLTMINIVFIGLSIFVIASLYSKNIKNNIMVSIILVSIFTVTEVVVLFVITLLGGISVEQVTEIEEYRLLGIILSKLSTFIILKIICIKHKNNRTLAMKTSYWIQFLAMFTTSIMTIFLIFKLQYESTSDSMYNFSVLCSFGLLYITFFSLYLYENIAKQVETEKEQEVYKQQIKAQAKHLDEILIAQKQIKKLRHDLVNHNISIQSFFEKQDFKAGLEYMRNMSDLIEISKGDVVETGNVALDAIINTKKSIAESKGIEFKTNIQIPEDIFIDAIDICMIFGNALDNAIEACEYIKGRTTKIKVSIVYEDNSVICKIVNTAKKIDTNFLHTIKKDKENHGFGIQNIESALSKYKNLCRFKQTNDEFILIFAIFKD